MSYHAKNGPYPLDGNDRLPWPDENLWMKSSFCTAGACVEVAVTDSAIFLRDGKQQDHGPKSALQMAPSTWSTIVSRLIDGDDDVSVGPLSFTVGQDGGFAAVDSDRAVSLEFDLAEREAFMLGLRSGELGAPTAN